MREILVNSEKEIARINCLLDKKIPSYRQAYSDRTAWLMACLSELAYIRFDSMFSDKEFKKYFSDKVSKLVDEGRMKSVVEFIDSVGYDSEREVKHLEEELAVLRLGCVYKFDNKGTQAILVWSDKFIALAFRGTEFDRIRDRKTVFNAKLAGCHETEGRVHSGFQEAFGRVIEEIREKLKEEGFRELPLFITGHSLGGALATIAAKRLSSHEGGVAACYTFGSPRVGDKKWISEIKTPIYRLVNAADFAPMLPPGPLPVTAIGFLAAGILPWVGKPLKSYLLSHFGDYFHAGDMRYLTNCPREQYENVKLLYSISNPYRLKGLFYEKALPWKKIPRDHAINVYRRKLEVIACNRNKTTQISTDCCPSEENSHAKLEIKSS
uniref:Lipase (Class 3) n=1 Tax=Candidatus Kentrum eta TaxID=2126337 RepID=A0A450VCP6_9GAMM|nr:MAG: Lipase (class 3) [Candidatus Kentron sp. H]VFJ96804.1 MAG: Lipase (class 3) [Candidatus Kentron sp. H]VFK02555.1 MAG: Lipase (class 3) [Candidatus Kentron sp. H]